MGLDIAFNRATAVAAGMEYKVGPRSTPESIAEAVAEGHEPDFIEWLSTPEKMIRVPGMEHWVADGGHEDIVVRANPGGMVYGPLTTWLKAKGITWDEF